MKTFNFSEAMSFLLGCGMAVLSPSGKLYINKEGKIFIYPYFSSSKAKKKLRKPLVGFKIEETVDGWSLYEKTN